MPIPDDYQAIVENLLSLTEQGAVVWKEGPNEWTFLASLKDRSVKIEDSGGGPGEEYTFALINSEGREIDSFSAGAGESEDFVILREMWQRAHRQAFGVDKVIADLRQELEGLALLGGPGVIIGSLRLGPASDGDVELRVVNIGPPGLGARTIDIVYDPSIASAVGCSPKHGGVCNPHFDTDKIRVTGASASGVVGGVDLATVSFKWGRQGVSPLRLDVQVLADATVGDPQSIRAAVRNGTIICHSRG